MERRLQLQEGRWRWFPVSGLKRREDHRADNQTRNSVFIALLQEVELYELEIGKATRTIQMYESKRTSALSALGNDIQARVERDLSVCEWDYFLITFLSTTQKSLCQLDKLKTVSFELRDHR